MLSIKRRGRYKEVIILSWNYLWIIFILALFTMALAYFIKQAITAVIGLGSSLLLLAGFLVSRKVVIDEHKKTIRLGGRFVEIKNIKSIRKGIREGMHSAPGETDYDAIIFELSDGKILEFPSRFSFSIIGKIDELFDFLKNELNLNA